MTGRYRTIVADPPCSARLGWDVWGDESLGTATMPGAAS